MTIEVNQPAIVLLNSHDNIGSLRNIPSTNDNHGTPDPFWSQRAYIYRMGNTNHPSRYGIEVVFFNIET